MSQLLFEFAIDPNYCQLCNGTRRTNSKCLFRNHVEDVQFSEPTNRPLAPVFLARDPIMVTTSRDSFTVLTDVETGHTVKISESGSLHLVTWLSNKSQEQGNK
jgi:hypothetical protein